METAPHHAWKKLSALVLTLALMLSILPGALAVDLNVDAGFYFKQSRGGTCTLASAAMMLRRRAYFDGLDGWVDVTENSVKSTAWSGGLSHSFTYNAMHVGYATLPSGTAAKTEALIQILQEHPEGIVLYDRTQPHAVLLTDYTDGVFYCSDPSNGVSAGRVPLSSASISISGASCYWYITSDANDDGTGLEELEAAVVAEEVTEAVDETTSTTAEAAESVWGWLDSLFSELQKSKPETLNRISGFFGWDLRAKLSPGEIVGKDLCGGLPLLGKGLCAPLAHADAVAVAAGGDLKGAILILHRETGAPQTERLPKRRAGEGLAADGQTSNIAGSGQCDIAEPVFGCRKVRCKPQPGCEELLHLRGRKGDDVSIVVGGKVGAAVHRDEIGDCRAPDILAGFGLAVGDGKVAGPGGGVLIIEHLRQDRVHQG